MADGEKIIQINIEEEMKSAYIDYSMSVIVSRALPDVRDGLKPVHRRVLFGMQDLGVLSNRPYKKSARIVGEVLGKYHPHGDTSVYDAMVRMAQEWSLRYPLVEGQGNFGSMDGDNPAAMRYTEAKLRKIAEEMLADIDKNTVDFQLNFDDTLQEPTVLPSKIPNLLVNGASGIAVGMATNMPPHNLTEVCKATIAYIENKEITTEQLMAYVKGPDFPTGGIIYGFQGIKDAFETGRGRIVMRARTEIENTPSGREVIVVKEVPYQVNKADMIKRIAELINEKKIEGISYINDETDRKGVRIVIICKKEAQASVVLNNLYKHTQLQSTFNVNNIALVHGRPKLLSLKQTIGYFVEHRHEVVIRRTKFDLEESEKKAHILEGLLIALDNLDAVISLIRGSKNPEEARDGLMSSFNLSEAQAKAILEMRLQRLTGLEREKIKLEYEELLKTIASLRELLADESLRMQVIKDELNSMIEQYGDERLTTIIPDEGEFNPEDFYADDDMIITVSHLGYIKRTPLSEFRTQARGGKGSKGSETRDEDFLEHMYYATMHNTMLFFTEKGKCFWQKVYEIPEGTKTSKGRAIQNLLNIEPNDKVKAFINLKSLVDQEYICNNYIVLCTRKGVIKKTSLDAYSRPRQNGINAINIREGDHLLEAQLTNGKNEIIIAVRSGKAIRFNEKTVRPMGRTASGVTGIRFAEKNDEVIGMICIDDPLKSVLVVSEKGYGKRTELDDYRITNRGGKGVKTINVTDKTGELIAIKSVTDKDDIMIINKSGLTIRLAVANLRLMGRATQGVRLINLRNNDSIAAVTDVVGSTEEGDEKENGNDEEANLTA
jgi:DNA gyrase subunit A